MSSVEEQNIPLPYFNQGIAEVPTEVVTHPAFVNFLGLTVSDRCTHTRHVEAHYQDNLQTFPRDFQDEVHEMMGEIPESADNLWSHIPPNWVTLDIEDDGKAYIVVTCRCPWDPDHGVSFSFENGTTLVMVGQYHDYPTNELSEDQPNDIVYAAIDPQFVTRRERD